jgi:hypothetical protein
MKIIFTIIFITTLLISLNITSFVSNTRNNVYGVSGNCTNSNSIKEIFVQKCMMLYVSTIMHKLYNQDLQGKTTINARNITIDKTNAQDIYDSITGYLLSYKCAPPSDQLNFNQGYICPQDVIDRDIGRLNYSMINLLRGLCFDMANGQRFVAKANITMITYQISTNNSNIMTENIQFIVDVVYTDNVSMIASDDISAIQGDDYLHDQVPGSATTKFGNVGNAKLIYTMLMENAQDHEKIYSTVEFDW